MMNSLIRVRTHCVLSVNSIGKKEEERERPSVRNGTFISVNSFRRKLFLYLVKLFQFLGVTIFGRETESDEMLPKPPEFIC